MISAVRPVSSSLIGCPWTAAARPCPPGVPRGAADAHVAHAGIIAERALQGTRRIDDQGTPKRGGDVSHRELAIVGPRRAHHQRIGVTKRLQRIGEELDVGREIRGQRADRRIVRPHLRPGAGQPATQLDGVERRSVSVPGL